MTAYTQTWSYVEARIGSPAKAGQIAGNFNTLIMLRVKEVATAELLTDQLPEVHVVSTIVSSSVSDTNDPGEFTDFASRNEDRIAPESVRMLEPTDLVQLPKGQAFALIHGGQLHKIRMPLPSADLIVHWGQRGRIGDPAIKPRATLVLAELMPWVPSASVAALPLPIQLKAGQSWGANLDQTALAAGNARPLTLREHQTEAELQRGGFGRQEQARRAQAARFGGAVGRL